MINAINIKSNIRPSAYYSKELQGVLGKCMGGGWNLWNGLCPFHADRNAGSFYINILNGAFKCHSCGAKGSDIISFHMQRYNLSFFLTLKDMEGKI